MKVYLVYRKSYDSDFDNVASTFLLGAYTSEDAAKAICDKDFCKKTYYEELTIGKETYKRI